MYVYIYSLKYYTEYLANIFTIKFLSLVTTQTRGRHSDIHRLGHPSDSCPFVT
jgi:hypothetical protein